MDDWIAIFYGRGFDSHRLHQFFMSEKEPIALVDMDGTLCDYSGQMKRDLELLASPEEKGKDYSDFFENEPEHIRARKAIIKSQSGWWRNLEVISSGEVLLHLLHEIGFEIHILTKGPNRTTSAWTEKFEWCKANIHPRIDFNMTITEKKGLVYGKVLVDDYPPYVESWLKWRPRGLVLMPEREWNEGFSHPNVLKYSDHKETGLKLDNESEVLEALRKARER